MKMYKKTIFSTITTLGMIATTLSCLPAMTASATTTYGDTNDDGSVTMSDVVLANRYLSGIVNSDDINLRNMDVDRNTALDVNDSKILLKYMVSSITSLPYSESSAAFVTSSYSVPDDDTRVYRKYDCSAGSTSSYTLYQASSVSLTSGANDDRTIDSSSNAKCIVKLDLGGGAWGTGFIVSNHIIATAAHCLYSNGSFISDVDVCVYDATGTTQIATYDADELHIPQLYITSTSTNKPKYDYGLVYVDENLTSYGNIALGTATDYFMNTAQTVSVSGFPGSVDNPGDGDRYIGVGGIITDANNTSPFSGDSEHNVYYTSYTSPGDSGGPVFIEYTLNGSTFRSAIGIHTHGDGNDHWGTRITTPLLRFYNNNSYIG